MSITPKKIGEISKGRVLVIMVFMSDQPSAALFLFTFIILFPLALWFSSAFPDYSRRDRIVASAFIVFIISILFFSQA